MPLIEKIDTTQSGLLVAHTFANLAKLDIFASFGEKTFNSLYKQILNELKKSSTQIDQVSLPLIKVLIHTILVLCDKDEDLHEQLI